MLSKLINKLFYKLIQSKIKPEIIGFKDYQGKLIEETGRSNMTHISSLENVSIGENVFIGHFNYLDGFRPLKIGKNTQITNYVSILTHSSHNALRFDYERLSKEVKDKVLNSGEVNIGEYSYIGAHSVIMPGTILGKGTIVSAYSYVNGKFPDFAILRGQPAKVIGYSSEMDEKLLLEFPELKEFYYNINANT